MDVMKVRIVGNSEPWDITAEHISPFLADLLSPGGMSPMTPTAAHAPTRIRAAEDLTEGSLLMLAQNAGARVIGAETRGLTL